MENISFKKCNKCNSIKPLSEFHRHCLCSDGRRSTCKECRKIESKENNIKNKNRITEYRKQYYQEHKEESKQRSKKYAQLHREQVNKNCRKSYYLHIDKQKERKEKNKNKIQQQLFVYRSNHKEEAREYSKKYRELKREELKTKYLIWKKDNPEIIASNHHIRRVRKKGIKYEKINILDIYKRDGWKCQICKKRVDKKLKYPNPLSPSLDHIIPLAKGGFHTAQNVQLAHLSCNVKLNTIDKNKQLRIF